MYEHFTVDCEWNYWKFGECSVTCGGGTRIDYRTIKAKEMYGGTCDPMGNQREVPCNKEACPRKAIIKNMQI